MKRASCCARLSDGVRGRIPVESGEGDPNAAPDARSTTKMLARWNEVGRIGGLPYKRDIILT
jgi:hypothetical protein